MTVRPIVIVGDPVLHKPTRPIEQVDDDLRTLIDDMFETMAAAKGVGLAANQVGVDLRVFVYDCPDEDGVMHTGHVINPVLETSERSEGMPDPDDDWEGCLSVPGEAFPTARADWAKVTGTDLDGNEVSVEGTGFLGRCLQHETDHLDGYLYLDRLVGRYKRESKRAVRSRGWGQDGITSWDPAVLEAEDV
ncbi:peptide deformylase [Epidermidibacterium keratini]|uniref:Peptide deformylase n=1 Tax=Epidermidibacterium keratini TaxID=1891644 RepID=A0A7L4YKN7_9ACTN|nr:peptide deformylase [Epidermidibacterium keratini]QHB99824.1 peptide deformylase [Epidermidibacterium keratini]